MNVEAESFGVDVQDSINCEGRVLKVSMPPAKAGRFAATGFLKL